MYLFFDFIVETYPKWIDLQNLQRQDIEDFYFMLEIVKWEERVIRKIVFLVIVM